MHHATNGGSLVEQKIQHALAGVLVSGILLILMVGAVAGQAAAQATKTDTQGSVTVKAVYVTPAYFKTTPTDALAGKVDLNRNVRAWAASRNGRCAGRCPSREPCVVSAFTSRSHMHFIHELEQIKRWVAEPGAHEDRPVLGQAPLDEAQDVVEGDRQRSRRPSLVDMAAECR